MCAIFYDAVAVIDNAANITYAADFCVCQPDIFNLAAIAYITEKPLIICVGADCQVVDSVTFAVERATKISDSGMVALFFSDFAQINIVGKFERHTCAVRII